MSACVVVLAAGEGARFGGEGKLLAPLGGRAVVAWAVDAACASDAEREIGRASCRERV